MSPPCLHLTEPARARTHTPLVSPPCLHLTEPPRSPAPAGGTRTCIHTPGEPMTPEEMTADLAERALQGASLVYFDGRLTEAALVLARAARARGVPVLVEAERLRPGGWGWLLEPAAAGMACASWGAEAVRIRVRR